MSDNPDDIAQLRARFEAIGCSQLSDASADLITLLPLALRSRSGHPSICGPMFPVVTNDDMLPCLQALADTPPGWVLFIHNTAAPSEALVGDIFATSALVQGLGGIIVNGAVRDVAELRSIDVPVFATSVTYVSARTTDQKVSELPVSADLGGVSIKPGEWVFGDDDGFLTVGASRVSAVLAAGAILRDREEQLKRAIHTTGESLAELTGLDAFVEGRGELGWKI